MRGPDRGCGRRARTCPAHRGRLGLRAAGVGILLGVAMRAGPAIAAPKAAPALEDIQRRVEALVRTGFERPDDALRGLDELRLEVAGSPPRLLRALAGIGLVAARSGDAKGAAAQAEALRALAPQVPGGVALAAAEVVEAEAAFNAGQTDVAGQRAQVALDRLLGARPAGVTTSAAPQTLPPPAAVPACEWRLAWGALGILERRWQTAGVNANASAQALAALRLVEWAGDTRRQSWILVTLARLADGRGDADAAERCLAQAQRLAAEPPSPQEQARIESAQASLLASRGELEAALRLRERAVALALQADAPRLRAQMLLDLADTHVRLRRPGDALEAATQGLEIARARGDRRLERSLVHNAGIAKIALGRTAEGRQDLLRVLQLWHSSGEFGRQAEALREFGEALAAAGEAREALALYHRERALSEALMRQDRAAALKALQASNDAAARERDIALLARETALQSEALANRDLQQWIWGLLALGLLLACGVAVLLYRRVRRTHDELAARNARLQSQSERDPLTNLANRRHCSSVMATLGGAPGGFAGALLLVDIDHFKRVNDRHGHAGGDRALVEVGQRLLAAVRAGDLVVRWGGEEFLILAPGATAEQAGQMAARILAGVGATPVLAEGRALRITVSVGHARFPLPAGTAPTDWERAVQFTDRALLAAKDGGRNRAVGIERLAPGANVAALLASQSTFVSAWRAGLVVLTESFGPTPVREVPGPA